MNGLKEHYDHVAEQIQAPDEFEVKSFASFPSSSSD